MSENLFTIFKNRFPADLSKMFLWRPDGSALSYADLVELSGRLANALKSLGVKPGDRVAAQVEKSAEALLVYLAALRAGAVEFLAKPFDDEVLLESVRAALES